MVDAGKMIEGPVREWLVARREELNARFRQTQRRYPRLDGARVLDWMASLLPPLADASEARSDELLASVYELILLHVARERLEIHDGALRSLLSETFPAIRPLLVQRPRSLCAALLNAVEHLGPGGLVFARRLPGVAATVEQAGMLLDAGAVLAWRLGEARLRESALAVASDLPARTVLECLGLNDWPVEAVPFLLSGLRADGWTAPEDLFTSATLKKIPRFSKKDGDALHRHLAVGGVTGSAAWRLTKTAGEFTGFGGTFDEPPLLLATEGNPSRHRIRVRSGTRDFRVEADVFGWSCVREVDAGGDVQAVKPRRGKVMSFLAGGADQPRLLPNGQVEGGGEGCYQVPGAAGAASYHLAPGVVAFTHSDSFRIRFAVPVRESL